MKSIILTSLALFYSFNQLTAGSISASKTKGCAPLNATFEYSESGIKSYNWVFGNGSTSTLANPSILFGEVGEYIVELTVTTSTNVTKTIVWDEVINVVGKPAVGFEVDHNVQCTASAVSFNNITEGADSFIWDFGDGNSSNELNPIHIYAHGGVYNISLVAFNETGCSEIITKNDYIIINEIAPLSISVDKNTSCDIEEIFTFSTSHSYASYTWDFGDGITSSVSSPTHSYNKEGIYPVTLTVADNNGCTSSKVMKDYIEIFKPKNYEIITSETFVCEEGSISFKGNFNDKEQVLWTFSDGTSSTKKSFEKSFNSAGVYDLELQVIDENNCISTIIRNDFINVLKINTVDIEFNQTSGCTPFNVTLENNTDGVIDTEWIIDGKSFTGNKIDHTFLVEGTYSVTTKMTHDSGCVSEVVYDSIYTVYDPENSIVVSTNKACVGSTISFELTNSDVTNVSWYIEGKAASFELNPEIRFETEGEYEISVSYLNENSCNQTISLPNQIVIHPKTIDYVSPEPIVICQSAEVFFNGGLGKDFWDWDFGDGNTSNEKNPVHFYEKPGNYIVSLTTNNIFGCQTHISEYNEIIVRAVETSFSASVIDTTRGCPEFTMQFDNTTPGAKSFLWDFGVGLTSTEESPIINFSTNAQFDVSLTVWDELGCSNTSVKLISSPWLYCFEDDFEFPGANIPDSIFLKQHTIRLCGSPANLNFTNPRPEAEDWFWDFGDGSYSTEEKPSHTYNSKGTYYVDLIASYADGNIDTLKSFTEVIIKGPDADFEYTPEFKCTGTEVTFNHNDNSIVSWQWEFENGDTSHEKDPSYLYTAPGVYQVSLQATDSLGCQSKSIKNLIIGNPYLDFNFEANLCYGDTLTIDHNLEGFNSFRWDFGDGNTSTDTYPKHLYNDHGEYKISLVASALDACEQNFEINTVVKYNVPEAGFDLSTSDIGCNEMSVSFINKSNNSERYFWDFGDGNTSTIENPSNLFTAGKYDVKMLASINGCTDTFILNDAIQVEEVVADFSFEQDDICLPIEISFVDKSTNAVDWLWDFGDGETSTDQNPSHTFISDVKEVSLMITSSSGCTESKTISLAPFLSVDFSVNKSKACLGEDLKFTNLSKNSEYFWWDFGDGTTSDIESPTHSYISPGTYTVSLKAISAAGCEIEVLKEELIEINEVKAHFDIEIGESTCAPLLVEFNNTSKNATQFEWKMGDGKASLIESPFHIYSEVGTYNVTLIAKNEIGCRDTLVRKDLINATGPTPEILTSDSIVCHPQEIIIQDSSSTATNWQWFFGDGNTSSDQISHHTYTEPGVYNLSLIATDEDGCEQFVKHDSIHVIPMPKANFSIEEYDFCLPVNIQTNNLSMGLQNAHYQWSFGDGGNSIKENPGHLYTKSGSYNISLIVTNEGLCADSIQFNESIMVYDTTYIVEPEVLRISVMDDKAVGLECSPYEANNFKYNVIYKSNVNQTLYQPFDTLWSATAVTYDDWDVKPKENAYKYKLQTNVYCHNPAQVDNLNSFKSINLKSDLIDDDIKVSWNHYQGHDFDYYIVSRKGEKDWEEIASIQKNQNEYLETEDLCPGVYTYQVKAINLDGRQLYSESNTTQVELFKNVFNEQQSEIIRTTVVDDINTYTEWAQPKIGPDKVAYYQVWRSDGSPTFELLEEVPAEVTSYYDESVNVQDKSFTYKVKVVNTCEIEARDSNVGKSILFGKETNNYKSRVFWTPYEGWESGVGKYLIQRLNDFGQWETVQEIDSLQAETIIDLSEDN